MSHVAVDDVVSGFEGLLQLAVSRAKAGIRAQQGLDPTSVHGLDDLFKEILNPFDGLETGHKQEEYFKECLGLVVSMHPGTHTHVHTHTHTHTHVHTHTHAHTHMYTHMCTHTHMYTLTHTHTHTCTHTHTHTHSHTCTHSHTHMYTHALNYFRHDTDTTAPFCIVYRKLKRYKLVDQSMYKGSRVTRESKY